MQNAIFLSAGLLIAGFALRAILRPLATLYIPGAVVAGVLGLLLVQLAPADSAAGALAAGAMPHWVAWRDLLVPVIFAALLLERPAGRTSAAEETRAAAQQAIAAWVIILGQLAVGLVVAAAVLSPAFGVSAHFGQLLEVSWAGGFGSSNAWGQQHEQLAAAAGAKAEPFAAARDFAVFFTTAGLVWGVVSGVALVNLGIRRGWAARPPTRAAAPSPGLAATGDATPDAAAPPEAGGLERLTLQLIWLAAAFGVGLLLQRATAAAVAGLDAENLVRQSLDKLPLFLFTLAGGWVVRRGLALIRADRLIDNDLLGRVVGFALDVLILTALATLRLAAIAHGLLPAAILLGAGAAWTMFAVLWVGRRVLPGRCWFELAILNHGFATATTAQGMMLLRMADPRLQSGAAPVYALAAPATAMFIGGGILTYVVPVLIHRGGTPAAMAVAAVATVAAAALFLAGRRLRQREPA